MSDFHIERAVRIAALGNIVVLSEQGTQTEYQLNAAKFIKDLNDAGWEIVQRRTT